MTIPRAILATALALAAASAAAAQEVHAARGQDAATQARDEAACSSWADQQTRPADAAAARADAAGDDQGVAGKGKKFLGRIPVTTLIGGPKSIAMGAATGLAGSQLAKSGGVVGDAASGAANMMSKVPIPTTQDVVGVAQKTVGGKEDDQPKAPGYESARAACLSGKGYTVE